jgi:hypothetical protein
MSADINAVLTSEKIDVMKAECWAKEDMRPPLDTFKTAYMMRCDRMARAISSEMNAELQRLREVEERAKSLLTKCGKFSHVRSPAIAWILGVPMPD